MARGRRANGEGTIVQTSEGWRAAIMMPDGKRKYLRGRTRKDVAAKLRAVQKEIDAGLPSPTAERVDLFLAWWLTSMEAKAANGAKSLNTVDNAATQIRVWINPRIGSIRLKDLTPEDVEKMLAAMAAAGKARQTIRKVRSYLAQALDAAMRRGHIARNVARIAEMPATKPPTEQKSLTADQAKSVMKAVEGDRLEALVITALMLGLRPGELCGLRWEDVDLDAGTLAVTHARKEARGKQELGDTKTQRSRRTLKLPAPVLNAIGAHRERQEQERETAGDAWADNGLVFASEVGTPIGRGNLYRWVAKLCERAEVPHVSPNELGRHTAASLLYDAGVPLDHIADLLGHQSTRMLESHYRHRVRPSVDVHVETMNGLFGEG